MIDIENGNIILNSEMIIGLNIDFDKTKSLNIEKKISEFKNGYKWIHFENHKVNNLYIKLSVCFYFEKTKMITFIVSKNELKTVSWENWNEQEEKEKVLEYENWLNNIIGVKREFNWGKISTNYDNKGGGTAISIIYNE